MLRKISFAILSVAIIVTGVIALRKLNYLDSSIWIFKLNSGQYSEKRMGHGFGEGAGRGRGQGMRERYITDSLRQELPPEFRERGQRIPSAGNFKNHDGRGRGEFRGGSKINLRNVLWFLAVFASLTVITFYIDKAINLIRRKKKSGQCQ